MVVVMVMVVIMIMIMIVRMVAHAVMAVPAFAARAVAMLLDHARRHREQVSHDRESGYKFHMA
jgi:hypothetical protein